MWGLEQYYEKELRGRRGVKYVVVMCTTTSKALSATESTTRSPTRGKNLYTSIDARMQAYGERLMQHKKGSIRRSTQKTGEILCLVSSPAYDPELLVGRVRNKNYVELQHDPLKPLFDRALQAQYPPGSSSDRAVTDRPSTRRSPGIPDSPATRRSSVAMEVIMRATSRPPFNTPCNPYFYQVFKKLIEQDKDPNRFKDAAIGLDLWHDYMMSFGLGQRPAVDLPSVKGGSIPSVSFYDRIYGKEGWAFSTIYSVSIGQGEVMVVPMQMAMLAATFANKGWYIDPHVVRAVGTPDSLLTKFERHVTKVDAHWYDLIQEGMRRVVNEPGGTARQARLDNITVCGKTGTAENPKDRTMPYSSPSLPWRTPRRHSGVRGEQRLRTWAAPSRACSRAIPHGHHQQARSEKKMLDRPDLVGEELQTRSKPRRR